MASVADVCERLDRLPLALELAAPRLRVLSLSELTDAVTDATTARPGDRHGSLGALAEWGYETLEEHERALFRRLGVFAGWFEREDAASLTVDPTPLTSLVEKSMIVAGRTSEGRARYRLLETLRAFARRRLEDAGEFDQARLAHAERMVWLAERLGLYTEESERWLWPKTEGMVDDVRAALSTLIQLRPRRAAWMAGTLRWFWRGTGRMAEGVRWSQIALEACPEPCLERCWALHGHAQLLLRLGLLDETRLWFGEATKLAALPECAGLRGELLIVQGLVHGGLGDPVAAEADVRNAISELTAQGRVDRATLLMNDLAIHLLAQGRAEDAHEVADRCVEGLRRINSTRVNFALDTLAQTDAVLGKFDQARVLWFEAAPIYLETHEVTGVATCLEGLAYAAGVREHLAVALKLHWCASHHWAQVSDSYAAEPLEPKVKELMQRLEVEVGPELAARLHSEGEALSLDEAIELARAEG